MYYLKKTLKLKGSGLLLERKERVKVQRRADGSVGGGGLLAKAFHVVLNLEKPKERKLSPE